MAKKIKVKKQRANTGTEIEDPNLEDIGNERGFEVELDEETNEIVFVMHYRRRFGDDFDADTEHGLNTEETAELIGVLIGFMEQIKNKKMIERATLPVIEGNPMQGPRIADKPSEGG